MSRTDWGQIVYDKELTAAKSLHKKQFITQKVLASDLPRYIDAGWEKCKDYKSPKFVGIAKEKPATEQFEDKIWLLLAGMGFNGLNAETGIEIAYDFNDDNLKERISVVAVDEETILIVLCFASENIVEKSFAEEINVFSKKIGASEKKRYRNSPVGR